MRHHDDKRPDERVVDYIYGELGPAAAARFEAEMEQNPTLATEVRGLQATADLIRRAATPIPDPPEVAVAEAMAAARARCEQLLGTAPSFWERIAARLLTPQFAGALTLVLVVSVGLYTMETGVFDRDAAQEPSVEHEMAPVGPMAAGEDVPATPGAPEKVTPRKAEAPPETPPLTAAPAPAPGAGQGGLEAAPAAAHWATEAEAAEEPAVPDPTPKILQEDRSVTQPDDNNLGREGAKQAETGEASRGLRSLVDRTAPDALQASPSLETAGDTTATKRRGSGQLERALGEVRTEVSDDTGNFVEKSVKKPEDTRQTKVRGLKKERVRKKETKAKVPAARDAGPPPVDDPTDKDQRAPATTFRKGSGEGAETLKPTRTEETKAAVKTAGAPKRTRSVLDGIVVPPPVNAPKEMKEVAPTSTATVLSLGNGDAADRAGGDDGFLDTGVGGASPDSGRFSTTATTEAPAVLDEAEPEDLTRPISAEAPGIMVKQDSAEKTAEAQRPAVPMGGNDEQERRGDRTAEAPQAEGKTEPTFALDAEVAMEENADIELSEASEKKAPAAPRDAAAVCAALARAIEDAEEAEDWALAEELTRQMVARGCVAGTDLEAVEEQETRFRQKAAEADRLVPAEESAPAENPLPDLQETNEPAQMK